MWSVHTCNSLSSFSEKVREYYESLLGEGDKYNLSAEAKSTMRSYTHVVGRINQASSTIGKDGRFQIFVCIGVRWAESDLCFYKDCLSMCW